MKNESSFEKLKYISLRSFDEILVISNNKINQTEILDKLSYNLKNKRAIIIMQLTTIDKLNYSLGIKIRQLSSIYNSIFLVQNRLDFIKYVNADGIVLDSNSIDISIIKKYIDNDKYIGLDVSQIDNISNKDIEEIDFLISNEKKSNFINSTKKLFSNIKLIEV